MGGGGFLGLGPAPRAPAAPDYTGAAQQTAAGNLEAARAAAAANRVNQITPYGSLVYSQQGTFDPQAYQRAYESYQKQLASAPQGTGLPEGYSFEPPQRSGGTIDLTGSTLPIGYTAVQPRQGFRFAYSPTGDRIEVPVGADQIKAPNVADFLTGPANPDQGWTATQVFSPDQQALYNYDIAASKGLGQLSLTGLDYVRDMMANPFSTSNLPNLQSQVNPANLQQISGGPQLGQMSDAEAQLRAGQSPDLQTSLGQNVGMAGWDRASNLLMNRLEPQLQRQEQRLDAQLAAQGIPVGSEAYTRAKQDLAMQQNDARIQAQLQSQGIQQNLFGQELQAGQFGNQALLGQNQAQLANLGFTNQAMQQDFANRMAGMGFNNQQIQQMYQNQVAQQQANNAIAQQLYGNQFTAADLANRARQQGFSELAYMRNEPLNTLNAVRSGAQVQSPNFVNSAQQATTSGPDYLSAAQMGYNAQMGDFNAQQAAQANLNQGLMGLGAAGIMRFSDPRTKENIKAVGVLDNGLTLYSFEYKDEFKDRQYGGHGVHVGVMADEVEQVFPFAVRTLDDGYKVVDYGLIP
jgi:Chaperone of endosialidase